MLRPAILYKEELLKKFSEQLYTDDYHFYLGYAAGTVLPKIEEHENSIQYAIIDKEKVIGFLCYWVDYASKSVSSFGLYSFDKGNPIIGFDLYKEMNKLRKRFHRIEWKMVGNNPVKKYYDKKCKEWGGTIYQLHDATIDLEGNYQDLYIYEVINK